MRRVLSGVKAGGATNGTYSPYVHEPHLTDTTVFGFFVVVVLSIGVATSAIKRHNSWVKLPFTLLVFMAGGVLGGVVQVVELGLLSDSIDNWRDLDPEILLFLFLPPLLFTSAFSVEYHIFRRLATQAVLLATVAVVINIVLIALVSMTVFDVSILVHQQS
jgi:NhaP-type Na+/H+ or K+/H+ antiporter